jgi:hypothetical protein
MKDKLTSACCFRKWRCCHSTQARWIQGNSPSTARTISSWKLSHSPVLTKRIRSTLLTEKSSRHLQWRKKLWLPRVNTYDHTILAWLSFYFSDNWLSKSSKVRLGDDQCYILPWFSYYLDSLFNLKYDNIMTFPKFIVTIISYEVWS